MDSFLSTFQSIASEISKFLLVIEIYIKMSEIPIFWLLALMSVTCFSYLCCLHKMQDYVEIVRLSALLEDEPVAMKVYEVRNLVISTYYLKEILEN